MAAAANHTSVTGVADSCRKDPNRQQKGGGHTPIADDMISKNASIKNIGEIVPITSL